MADYASVGYHHRFGTGELVLHANYGHDWVEFDYPAGYDVTITVEAPGGAVKGISQGTTGPIPDWGGTSGFTTWNTGWDVGWVDLEPGDTVTGELDNGKTSSLVIGTIEGVVDAAANTVERDYRHWVQRRPGGALRSVDPNGPHGIDFTVTGGNDAYACDFDDVGWDVSPQHDVAVSYPSRTWTGCTTSSLLTPAPTTPTTTWTAGSARGPR